MFVNDLHGIFHDCRVSENIVEKFFKKKTSLLEHNGFLLIFSVNIHLFCQRIHSWKFNMRVFFAQSLIKFHHSRKMNLDQLPLTYMEAVFWQSQQSEVFTPKWSCKASQIDSIVSQPTQRSHFSLQHFHSKFRREDKLLIKIESKRYFIIFTYFIFLSSAGSIDLQFMYYFFNSSYNLQPRSCFFSEEMQRLVHPADYESIFIVFSIRFLLDVAELIEIDAQVFSLFLETEDSLDFSYDYQIVEDVQFYRKI